jgi:Tol biopolymer transport system component
VKPVWRVLIVLVLAGCTDKLPSGPAGVPGRLVFSTNRNLGQWDLYVMNPNGSSVGQIDSSLANDLWPNWSPDGTTLVFQSDRVPQAGDSVNYNIFVIRTDRTAWRS